MKRENCYIGQEVILTVPGLTSSFGNKWRGKKGKVLKTYNDTALLSIQNGSATSTHWYYHNFEPIISKKELI